MDQLTKDVGKDATTHLHGIHRSLGCARDALRVMTFKNRVLHLFAHLVVATFTPNACHVHLEVRVASGELANGSVKLINKFVRTLLKNIAMKVRQNGVLSQW